MPKASIIMVNYNGLEHLPDCLRSIKTQDWHNEYEIILVDNASTDGSPDMVASKFPEVKIIPAGDNVGFANGCNLGIKAADAGSDYLVFLNYDTVAAPDWLKELTAAAERNPDAGIITSKILLHDKPDVINSTGTHMQYLGFGWSGDFGKPNSDALAEGDVAAASGAAMLVKREIIDHIGGFDEFFFMYHEDTDLSWRVWLSGRRVVFAPKAVVFHKYHFGKGWYKFYYLERNRLKMCLKNYRLKTLVILFPVFVFSETGMLAYFLIKRSLGSKIKSYLDIIKSRHEIMDGRRKVQAMRRVPDSEIIKLFESRIVTEGADNPLQRYIANPVYAFVWAFARRLI